MKIERFCVHLMRQVEVRDMEIARLQIALFGHEAEPQSPFPLLHGEEILAVLHPRDWYRGGGRR